MCRNSSAEHEDVGLRGATPFLDKSKYFGNSRGGRARQRARERVGDVHLDRADDVGVQSRAVERGGEPCQVDREVRRRGSRGAFR